MEQAVLPLHCRGLAATATRHAAAARVAQQGPQPALEPSLQPRRASPCRTNGNIPWFAAWDLAFHMIPFARIDGQFAKEQLGLMLREWYMHPNGQIAGVRICLRRRQSARPCLGRAGGFTKSPDRTGQRDRDFLESVFQKLLLNFTWWVNRKDPDGKNLFSGGFLGLDNIGVFDRSQPLPNGGMLRAGRRHRVDGVLLRDHAGDRAGTGACDGGKSVRPMRTWPRNFLSTSCRSPTR